MNKSRVFINTKFYSYYLYLFSFFKTDYTKKFHQKLAFFLNKKNILLMSQGRVGLFLISKLLVKKNKKIFITSPYTLTEALNSIKYAGGKIIFVDINLKTGLPEINQVKQKLRKYGAKNCSILITHLYSSKKNILKFISTFKKNDLIEDTAINFGASVNKKKLGTLANYGFFSFGTMKNLCLFNGGLVFCKNKNDLVQIKKYENEMINYPNNIFIKKTFLALIIDIVYNKYIYGLISCYLLSVVYKFNIKFILKIIYPGLYPNNLKNIPDHFKYKYNKNVSEIGIKLINCINADFSERISKVRYYRKFLNSKYINHFDYSDLNENAFLEYPVLCKDKTKKIIIKKLFKNGYDLRYKWYVDNSKFFSKNKFKNSQHLEKNVLCFPVNKQFKIKDIKRICKIINLINYA